METEEQARNRFQSELEFVQCLANPNYLNCILIAFTCWNCCSMNTSGKSWSTLSVPSLSTSSSYCTGSTTPGNAPGCSRHWPSSSSRNSSRRHTGTPPPSNDVTGGCGRCCRGWPSSVPGRRDSVQPDTYCPVLNSFAPPVVFELTDKVGGTWCYDERVGTYDNGLPVHSSMYRDLKTNLPKEVMMFPDYPFDPKLNSFLPHQEVQRYLEGYCQSYNILPHIRFNTVVESVKPVGMTTEGGESRTTWKVTSSDPSGHRKTETFDSVFVCSGHYSHPHTPDIPGIENFKGKVLHSHVYRYAEPFSGQSVVVLGAKASGLDISIELAKVGAQVTLSHGRPRFTFPLPPGIRQSSPAVAVDEDGSIRFQDGSVGTADVLMFCTGYKLQVSISGRS
ncbi:Flavin-containing monooxygenase FMO GS-OX-like 8 [Larimichthys crocea]|uniref:Uncharacterized protein n=1 Tax=Larimichthys crocea TaxID=215358 RepID=A0ACD3R3Z8_LARCR|nr:Flavin-containing monooxygenase FMO GS-OX-like 8 [Larimichthys crocea]